MKRFISMVCFFLIMAVVLFPVVAYAIPPMSVSGDLVPSSSIPVDMHQADGNTIIREIEYGDMSGTIVGSYAIEMMVVIHSNGKLNMHGISTIDLCVVDGKSGTIIMNLIGTGAMSSPTTGVLQGTWVILSGTGDLANLRGQGTFAVETGVGGTYSGQIHFDPK